MRRCSFLLPLSEHADRFMDLTGFTELLAVSRNQEANAMVCARYRHDFGPANVYSVNQGSQAVSLFALDDRGKLKIFSSANEFNPAAGWTIIRLDMPNEGANPDQQKNVETQD
jgi:hypothetical protein